MCVYSSTPAMVLDVREVLFRFQGFRNFQNSFIITYFSILASSIFFQTRGNGSKDRASFESVQCIMHFTLFLPFFSWLFGCTMRFTVNIFVFLFFLCRYFYFKYSFNLKETYCTNGMFSCLQIGMFLFEFPKDVTAL